MRMKTILLALAMLWLNVSFAEKEIEIRISPEFINQENHTLYAAVEILAADHETIVLADQNYRLYYNSAIMSLDQDDSYSDLPIDKYSQLEILESIEGAVSSNGQLSFDANLGFINFKIDLIDDNNGGVRIANNDGWQKVAVLKFNIKNSDHNGELVWSRPQVTDHYATAFVEITEWIAPFETNALNVSEYRDGMVNLEEITAPIHIAVGPNPTADFINLEFDIALNDAVQILVTDVAGRTWVNDVIPVGTKKATVDISALNATMYMVEILDIQNAQRIQLERISKVD